MHRFTAEQRRLLSGLNLASERWWLLEDQEQLTVQERYTKLLLSRVRRALLLDCKQVEERLEGIDRLVWKDEVLHAGIGSSAIKIKDALNDDGERDYPSNLNADSQPALRDLGL